MNNRICLGIIIGNRGFFPAHLCDTGRQEILSTLSKAGIDTIILPTSETKFGAVESMSDAEKCARLFEENRIKSMAFWSACPISVMKGG